MSQFVKNADGVHIKHPSDAEETLCGIVFSYKNIDTYQLEDTQETTVTCQECSKIIQHLRRVKVGRKALDGEGKANADCPA